MKRCLVILLLLAMSVPCLAQSRREALLEYQARRRQAYAEFQDNYRKACTEFMRKRWEAFRSEAPIPQPARREPDRPVTKKPDAPVSTPQNTVIPHGEVRDLTLGQPATPDVPKQSAPSVQPRTDRSRPLRFTFYGTECSVSLKATDRVRLASPEEKDVANAWEHVAAGSYDRAARECADLKNRLRLNDWGYYRLACTVGDALCGAGTNESVIVQSFLMTEAGYKVRLARAAEQLHLLIATDDQIYANPYFRIDGQTFYLLDGSPRADAYHICNFAIPGERVVSMAMPEPPLLAEKPGTPAVRNCRAAGIETSVTPNRNLIDFMEEYPPCYWDIYAATSLSEKTREELLPVLRKAAEGKDEHKTAGLLLDYLHEAFPYKTDQAQFGQERTLFAEEMFHYPYSDCEDRSILYVQLVRELLGLKTVLLYYPNHIAAAVRFKQNVTGDYVQIGSDRYTVCDPTYIGAEVGESMPDLKQVPAQIIRID